MRDLLTPDFMFDTYRDVTPAFLRQIGVGALLLDIDNTFAPYEQPEPDAEILAWFEAMRQAGVKMAFVSNNDAERVNLFNEKIGIPAFPKAGKPTKKSMRTALAALGAVPAESAILGDQLLTDALAGKRLGMRALIVPPIRDKKNAFFRFKRWLEKPFIRKYHRMQRMAR